MALLKRQDIQHPFGAARIRKLRAGDMVSVSGRIYTGRDRLHRYLADGGACPVDLRDGALFHCGPIVVQKDGKWIVKSAGPTTSSRQDPYMAAVIEKYQVRVIIGKGGMGEQVRQACIKHGCVYLQTVGGAGALLASCIKEVASVHFLKEFGAAEAMWELEAVGLPAIVAMDAGGRSIYKRIALTSRSALGELADQSFAYD